MRALSLAAGLMVALLCPVAAEAANPAPDVVPSIREWSGGTGTFQVDPDARIVVGSGSLAGEAGILRDDLAKATGYRLPIVDGGGSRRGDVVLSGRRAPAELGPEGYVLEIGDRVEVSGGSDAGVFYGTQTVVQALRSQPGSRTLPRGTARDWPRFRERGYLLDVGRKYWSPDFVVQTIREMAYLKLNTLQLHFTDNNAFRLVSDRFPYLAAPDAYTKADIGRFEAAARRHHVTIIPEIEMPAHAGAIIAERPDLRLDCLDFGTTLDVTRPEVRAFTKALIDEFAPLFSGPEFHIATDEYAGRVAQQRCPQLLRYASEHGLGSPADVFVDYINEMNRAVRAHGKTMVIWNWWDVNQDPTIAPDKTIKVEAWTTSAETGEDHSPQKYLAQGYEVVVSPSDTLYVTQGFPLLPNPRFLYEEWEPLAHPRLAGYQISVWSDNAITRPESSFDAYLRRPREAMADRTWGGPRHGAVADFFARADAIGTPAGVPEYVLPNRLTGTPYGTSPGYEPTSTFDKAFDGDPITYFLFADPSGGHTGIDLGAGRESAVSLVRFFATPGEQNLDRMVGGRFEGCAEGPAEGCRTLATVEERPAFGWNELAVGDTGRYRWLRYVGPDDGYGSVAEIEFLAPATEVAVEAPGQLRRLGDNRVVTSYRNTGTRPVYDVRLGLGADAADDRAARAVEPTGRDRFAVVRPGERVSTAWQVDVPLSAKAGGYHLVGDAGYQRQPGAHQPLVHAGALARTTLGPALDVAFDPEFVDLDAGESQDARLQITNHAARPVTVRWSHHRSPTLKPGFRLEPAEGSLTVPAGGTSSATLTASAAAGAAGTGPGRARVDLAALAAGQPETRFGAVELRVLWYPGALPSLAAAYDNKGITDDGNPTAGTFDGGVASYSAQGLAAAGLGRGATVVHDGLTFLWPDTAPGEPDNVATDGQVIAVSGSGAKLGFLGASAFGIHGGSVFITYTDGSVVQAPLTFADWWTNDPVAGTETVATAPWNVPPEVPDPDHPVSVYYAGIPLDPGKTVRFITLPADRDLHVFSMAIGGS